MEASELDKAYGDVLWRCGMSTDEVCTPGEALFRQVSREELGQVTSELLAEHGVLSAEGLQYSGPL